MEDGVEELAKKRVQARTGFMVHLLIYVFANTGFAVIWLATGRGYPWFVWPLFGWGIGLVSHAISFAIGPGSAAEQRAVEREVQRLRSAHR